MTTCSCPAIEGDAGSWPSRFHQSMPSGSSSSSTWNSKLKLPDPFVDSVIIVPPASNRWMPGLIWKKKSDISHAAV